MSVSCAACPMKLKMGKVMEFHLNSFFEGDPAVEQATADPDQPEAVHEEVSEVSEECRSYYRGGC
jgi:hypothetical protein